MKVLHVSCSDSGGAGIALRRLHHALLSAGVESRVVVLHKTSGDAAVERAVPLSLTEKLARGLGSLTNRTLIRLGQGQHYFSIWPTHLARVIAQSGADLVHYHWPLAEMMSLGQMAGTSCPVVWTCHDMWLFTGSAGYSDGPEWWAQGTEISADSWIDRQFFARKQKIWKDWHPTIIAPSRWMANCASRSKLFGNSRILNIPNCLDTSLFKPRPDRRALRQKYDLPERKIIILFGAMSLSDRRKGRDLFEQALDMLEDKERYLIALFGTATIGGQGAHGQISGIDASALGRIFEPTDLADLYNVADVMCIPSRQDNLPNTGLEALACGTPVVAFETGGLPDIVDHQHTGFLAEAFDVRGFSKGIAWIADNNLSLREFCRMKAENTFSPERVAAMHYSVYEKLVYSCGHAR
jgi:glycosyltransferase involved in cell wall biosynthesis